MRQPDAGGHGSRQSEHGGVHRDDGVNPPGPRNEPGGAALGVAGVGGQHRLAAQRQRPVAAHHDREPHPARRRQEVAGPVGLRRNEQQRPRPGHIRCAHGASLWP
jgi:hypothetical protein